MAEIKDFIVAIELGSSKVTGIAGQKKPDGSISVLEEMLRITKQGDSREEWQVERCGTYSFVPMLDGKQMR